MDTSSVLEFLHRVEPLKSNPRHCVTAAGVPESVAAHCWRLTLLALLLEDEFPQADMNKVLRMCLLHDLGEAVTGDIPTFEKTGDNQLQEQFAVFKLIDGLPEELHQRFYRLLDEIDRGTTQEARIWKALDMMEAVIQHNESPISSWLPLEYDLQQTYGVAEAERFAPLAELREAVRQETLKKIADAQTAEASPSEEQ